MILKEIINLSNQSYVYAIEDADGVRLNELILIKLIVKVGVNGHSAQRSREFIAIDESQALSHQYRENWLFLTLYKGARYISHVLVLLTAVIVHLKIEPSVVTIDRDRTHCFFCSVS